MSAQDAISTPSEQPQSASAQSVLLERVCLDAGTQSRLGGHDPNTVRRYAEEMQGGRWEFERQPLPLLFFDGEHFYPGDGHHRILAAQMSGLTALRCDVRSGDRRQAQFYSNTEANKYHGKQLTRKDKRNRVENLLLDHEWTLMSDREIARCCGVSAPFVGTVRKSLVASAKISSSNKRRGKDGKVRDTTKIGRVKLSPEQSSQRSPQPSSLNDLSASAEMPWGSSPAEPSETPKASQFSNSQAFNQVFNNDADALQEQRERNQWLEEAIAADELLIQQLYDGLGTIRAALDPDQPLQALREDVAQAARGIDLMRRILEAQSPNLIGDSPEEDH